VHATAVTARQSMPAGSVCVQWPAVTAVAHIPGSIVPFVLVKPPPPVGAGGGYMFSGRPSVRASVRPCVRPSVIHVVVLCFRDISGIC